MLVCCVAGGGALGGKGGAAAEADAAKYTAQIEELSSLVRFYEQKVSAMSERLAKGGGGSRRAGAHWQQCSSGLAPLAGQEFVCSHFCAWDALCPVGLRYCMTLWVRGWVSVRIHALIRLARRAAAPTCKCGAVLAPLAVQMPRGMLPSRVRARACVCVCARAHASAAGCVDAKGDAAQLCACTRAELQ